MKNHAISHACPRALGALVAALMAVAVVPRAGADKFVEYIESNGNANTPGEYILLDYTPTSNSVVEAEVAIRRSNTNHGIFCARDNAGANSFTLFYIANQGYRWDYCTSKNAYQKNITVDKKYKIRCTNEGLWLDGVQSDAINVSPLSFAPANKMMLFASYNCDPSVTPEATGNYAGIRLYSFKAWDDNGATLRAELHPYVDNNGNAALFDAVTGTIYYNLKAGKSFTASTTEVERPVMFNSRLDVVAFPQAHGEPTPAYGTLSMGAGGSLPVSCPEIWTNATEDVAVTCLGWKLYDEAGNVVSNGTENAFTYTHPSPAAYRRLEWQLDIVYKVTATAGSGGSVTPTVQWIAHGETATVTATPNAGGFFNKWRGDVPNGVSATSATISFSADGPRALIASFDHTYHWAKVQSSGYGAAANWEENEVPPSDIENTDVVFPIGTSQQWITGFGKVHSITLLPSSSYVYNNNALVFSNYSSTTIGAGGVTMDDPVGAPWIYGYTAFTLACSQQWKLDGERSGSGLTVYSKVIAGPDVVWTVSGRRAGISFTGGSGGSFEGQLRTNGSLSFSSLGMLAHLGTNLLTWSNNNAPYQVVTNASGVPNQSLAIAVTANTDATFATPVLWDLTNPAGGKLHVYLYGKNTGTTHPRNSLTFTNTWSGDIGRDVIHFKPATPSATSRWIHNPFFYEKVIFAQDGSGLATNNNQRLWLENGVYEIAHANAFGFGNAMPVILGGRWAAEYYPTGEPAALFAAPGITVAAPIVADHDAYVPANGYLYNFHGVIVHLGCTRSGTVRYTGTVAVNDSKHNPQSNNYITYTTPEQVRLDAWTTNATAIFDGPLSGGKAMPFTVHGAGRVVLSADNTDLAQGLVVRGGSLVLAGDDAAGFKPITLGGTVPEKDTVRVHVHTNLLTSAYAQPPVLDGVTLSPGDRIFCFTDLGQYGVYELGSDLKLTRVSGYTYLFGKRIVIQEGEQFGGTSFEIVRGSNNGWHSLQEPRTDPDVALLADGPRVITNDVAVTDNLSCGTSTIGGCTADISVFSGKITLNRDVTFRAAAGGVVRFTGSIADAGETLNPFAFSGTGTVELPAGTELASRAVSFPGLTDAALDATGSTVCTLVTAADGLTVADIAVPSLSKWQLRVKPTSIRAVKNVGTMIIMQ